MSIDSSVIMFYGIYDHHIDETCKPIGYMGSRQKIKMMTLRHPGFVHMCTIYVDRIKQVICVHIYYEYYTNIHVTIYYIYYICIYRKCDT